MLRISEQAYATDTGRQRHANEDSFFVGGPFFVVADGMGGAQAGEVASETAAESFGGPLPSGPPEEILRQLIEAANRKIHEMARRDPSIAGMGTTITAVLVDPDSDELAIGHVGDSRAYRLRDSKMERLTRDHSLVEEMIRKGQITEEQAEEHPQRSIITRALGPEEHVEVDVQTVVARPGDTYLLCSDGLTTMVLERRIAEIIKAASGLQAAVDALVEAANEAGGRDNITAVSFRFEDVAKPAEDADPEDRPTLVGSAAEREGLTTDEVRRGAAAQRETVLRQEPVRPAARSRSAAAQEDTPSRRRGFRRAGKVLLALLLIAGLGLGAWFANRQVWFLGTDDGGRVALYRGLPYELPLGIDLYERRYASPIQTDSLPRRRQDAVTDHDLRSRDDAVSLVEDIERMASAANANPELSADSTPTQPQNPEPTPNQSPGGQNTPGASQGDGIQQGATGAQQRTTGNGGAG